MSIGVRIVNWVRFHGTTGMKKKLINGSGSQRQLERLTYDKTREVAFAAINQLPNFQPHFEIESLTHLQATITPRELLVSVLSNLIYGDLKEKEAAVSRLKFFASSEAPPKNKIIIIKPLIKALKSASGDDNYTIRVDSTDIFISLIKSNIPKQWKDLIIEAYAQIAYNQTEDENLRKLSAKFFSGIILEELSAHHRERANYSLLSLYSFGPEAAYLEASSAFFDLGKAATPQEIQRAALDFLKKYAYGRETDDINTRYQFCAISILQDFIRFFSQELIEQLIEPLTFALTAPDAHVRTAASDAIRDLADSDLSDEARNELVTQLTGERTVLNKDSFVRNQLKFRLDSLARKDISEESRIKIEEAKILLQRVDEKEREK